MLYVSPSSSRVYSHNSLSQWMLCQRRWYWYAERGLVLDVKAPPLHFGGAIHEGRREWYHTGSVTKMLEAFHKAMEGSPPDALRTPEKGELILKGYAKKWPLPEPFKILANEISFRIPMPDGSTLVGRMDAVLDWDGRILVGELKTTSGGIGSYYFNGFSPSLQVDIYCYACKHLYGRCDGALIDAVQVCKTKEGYARHVTDRTPEDLARFEKRYMQIVADIEAKRVDYDKVLSTGVEEQTARDIYIQDQNMCTYFGECPYRTPLCLYNEDGLIEGRYVQREIRDVPAEKLLDGTE